MAAKGVSRDEERLSAVLGDVYDAAVDPALWGDALRSASEMVGAGAGFLYFQDLAGAWGDQCYAWGDDPEHRTARFEAYSRHNPAHGGAEPLTPGEVRIGSAAIPQAELLRTPLGTEWMVPHGFCDFATAVLERSNLNLICLTFANADADGCMPPEAARKIELLIPHFRRAASIAEALGLQRLEVAALAEALDQLRTAVFLVDDDGQIVHSNRSGRDLLEAGVVLNSRRDVLSATDAGAEKRLREALSGAVGSAPSRSDPAPVELAGDDGLHLAYVLPLDTGLRREAGRTFAATAAVFVHEARVDPAPAVAALARAYGLTRSEVRVLTAALQKGGAKDIARSLNLSQHTVQTHFKRLFEKTGVRRRDELFKLATNYVGPLDPG